LGDSVAISWVPGLRKALEPLGYRIEVLTNQQCPAADVLVNRLDGSQMADCPAFRKWTLERVDELRPSLVIASNVSWTLDRLTSGATSEAAQAEWEAGLRGVLIRLERSAGRVFLLQGPPTGQGFDKCKTRNSTPTDCLLDQTPNYLLMNRADRRAIRELNVNYVGTEPWFCSPEGLCPSFVAGTPVLADGSHLTAKYSRALAHALAEALGAP
jgi:hypothetical protein